MFYIPTVLFPEPLLPWNVSNKLFHVRRRIPYSLSCVGPLFTTFAQHSDIDANYLYLGSAEGHLFKLYISSSGEIQWFFIDAVNPISQSMCMLGTAISVNQDDSIRNDILLYAGECANSQVIAVRNIKAKQNKTYLVEHRFLAMILMNGRLPK